MLGFLEQQPVYNAIQFQLGGHMGPGWPSTPRSASPSSRVPLPLGCYGPPIPVPAGAQWSGRLNNYFASVGTTIGYQGRSTTTGVFTQADPAYGVQHITDGTSNTIAFGESLVGPDSGGYQTSSVLASLPERHQCRTGSSSGVDQPLRRQLEP